ncbi:histone-lysine N-methyltransferase eggless-like [Cimex lectularius]|uniref:Histone-lysine N-methyltransferase eggless n=1 Tax=Cimex lectularius TaxID=79782 RepID=A0A8I6RZA2_CIMLE|nr:histone-lysine N-methyltransferase eggless-like [Cimex lectularius]
MSYVEDVVRIDDEDSDSDVEVIFEKCFSDEKRSGCSGSRECDKGLAVPVVHVLCDCCDSNENEAISEPAKSLKHLPEVVVIEDSDDEGVAGSLSPRGEQLSFAIDDICKTVFDRLDSNGRTKTAEGWIRRSSAILNDIKALQKDVRDIDVGLAAAMQSLYEAYRPATVQLTPVEIVDVPCSSSSHARTPLTSSLHKTPKIGDRFLFEEDNLHSDPEWVPGTIVQVVNTAVGNSFEERYIVQAENKHQNRTIVDRTRLAYCDGFDLSLFVGSRIVAIHTKSITNVYQSGMVAELPSQMNKSRYLVFYNCGSSLYVMPHDVHKVLECNKQPHEYFNKSGQKFIKMYLSSFPERCMLEVKHQEVVKTSFKGAWCNARVIDVDASLVNVLFVDYGCSEWLYRGSTRFFRILEKKTQERCDWTIRHRGITSKPNNRSCVQHEILEEEVYDSASTSNSSVNKMEKSNSNTFARKRNCKRRQNLVREQSTQRFIMTFDSGRVVKKYPQGVLYPKIYSPHTCSQNCVNWLSSKKEEENTMNPLAIPSVFAFKRKVEGVRVTYTSPCGKRLYNYEEILSYISDTELLLSVDLFDFDPKISIFNELVVPPECILIEDVSRGGEIVPIPCINIYDYTIPDLMEYITERRSLEGAILNVNPEFLVGCDCTDNCSDKSICACWQQTIKQAREFDFTIDPDKIGYKYKKLPEMLLTGIYECNSTCKCKNTCLNRVVQHPLRLRLQLFLTKKKGWGTRCVNDVAAGTFICLYIGNILNEQLANKTGKAYGDEYFAELDYIDVLENHKNNFEEFPPELEEEFKRRDRDPKQLGVRREGDCDQSRFSVDCNQNNAEKFPSVRSYYGPNESVYIMDSKNAGNIGRFLNHSCDPNTFVQNVFVDTHDLRFPWVAFFALKHIPAGTELTWHYGYDVGSVPGKKIYCFCEAPNCRKRLL